MNATQTPEEWRPVVGWEWLYEVSSRGRVRSLDRVDSLGRSWRGRIRRLGTHPFGYKLIVLNDGSRTITKLVHPIVLTVFSGERPAGMVCCHNDGNPSNNHIENLRWDTQSENLRDAVRHGTHTLAAKTHCPHGHAYDQINTHVNANGHRSCRRCNAERSRTGGLNSPALNALKTHCPRGHEYSSDNTKINSKGGRQCRTCMRQNQIDRRRRLRAAGLPVT